MKCKHQYRIYHNKDFNDKGYLSLYCSLCLEFVKVKYPNFNESKEVKDVRNK